MTRLDKKKAKNVVNRANREDITPSLCSILCFFFSGGWQVIRCLLISPNPESALNAEAGKLQLEDFEEFKKRAAIYTRKLAKAPPPEPRKKALDDENSCAVVGADSKTSGSSSSVSAVPSASPAPSSSTTNVSSVKKSKAVAAAPQKPALRTGLKRL